MKKLLSTLLCLVTISSFAGIQIVTDFDDTIKRSNIVNGGIRTVGRTVLFHKAYTGMPELFQQMRVSANGLYVLSASPRAIRSLIKGTLRHYKIPYTQLFTRHLREIDRNGKDTKKIAYKIQRIESVIKENPNDSLVLLGDNIEADHIVYMKVAARNTGKIKDIYIRKVFDYELPVGINGFYSAFEVAAKEYAKKRMTLAQVKIIAHKILATKKHRMYRVIPYYAHCPLYKYEFNLTSKEELMSLEEKVIEKITEHCIENVDEYEEDNYDDDDDDDDDEDDC